jgi:hypothetical protein
MGKVLLIASEGVHLLAEYCSAHIQRCQGGFSFRIGGDKCAEHAFGQTSGFEQALDFS